MTEGGCGLEEQPSWECPGVTGHFRGRRGAAGTLSLHSRACVVVLSLLDRWLLLSPGAFPGKDPTPNPWWENERGFWKPK